MKILINIIFCTLFLITTSDLYSESIWRDRNIYSSNVNIKTGDVVVVMVSDISRFKFDVKLKNNTTSDIQSNPDMTITGFLPKVSSNKNYKNNDSTGFEGNSKIEFSIASQIGNIQNNGIAAIRGSRIYTFNGVTTTVSISGLVDPKLLKAGSVDSDKIANFRILISGSKTGLTINKNQVTGDDTASAELTEQEKQTIIIDYMRKIVRELTK